MTTTLSTERLVLLIDALSRNISEIATLLKQDAENALPASDTRKGSPKRKEKTETSTPAVSTEPEPIITIEQIRGVLAEKSQAGLTNKVKELLQEFGSIKLSGIDPSRYKDLMEAAKGLQ